MSEAPTVPQHLQRMFFKKVGNSRPLFIYFCLFNKVDNKQVNKQMFNINFADDWSLVSKATALHTEPQPHPDCRAYLANKDVDLYFLYLNKSYLGQT